MAWRGEGVTGGRGEKKGRGHDGRWSWGGRKFKERDRKRGRTVRVEHGRGKLIQGKWKDIGSLYVGKRTFNGEGGRGTKVREIKLVKSISI